MSMKAGEIFQFGEFQIDARARTLRREDQVVALNFRAFDVLLYFAQNPGRTLTRDELLKNVWPDTYVDEHSLAQSISVLRRALDEKPGENGFIVTLPGRGYQFVAAVKAVAPEMGSIAAEGAASTNPLLLQQQTIQTTVVTEEKPDAGAVAVPGTATAGIPLLWKIAVPILLVGVLVAGGYYYRVRQRERLTEKDTIVLADFANSTGDAVFDDTLKTGLTISLRQSPFLNVLSDGRVARTLQLMTRPPGTKLTPQVARELCQRAGSKAYISGSIDGLGSEYVLALKAVNCQSGDALAEDQVTAASKEKVLDELGKAASKLRGELGESLATVQKFDVPLAQATTPSLEALKAFSLGGSVYYEKGAAAALPYHQRAIELDPNFVMAYRAIGLDYAHLGQTGRTREYVAKAFQLREHASERERLALTANYYQNVTRELDKAIQIYRDQIESYPREFSAYNDLGLAYAAEGQYERAAAIAKQGRALAPEVPVWNQNLATDALALQRFDEMQQISDDARARKAPDEITHTAAYALAFLRSDSAGMAEQQQWFASKHGYENFGLKLASDTEAYAGHVAKARELTREAVDSAVRSDDKEFAAITRAIAAQQELAYGNSGEALQSATAALKLAPTSQGAESESALAFAMAGDTKRAESLADDLDNRFPLDTQMQSLWLPAIRAQVALDQKNTASALNTLQKASLIEFGNIPFVSNISCLYPTYVRGEAYLAAGQGSSAAAEFQKILDHNGIVWNCWTGALARLGVARANALQSKTARGADADAARARALAAYKDFLTLWKDADSDIPILKEAKAENSKLAAAIR
jgi:eukaryotic-like serine/threonine-protein kinase